MIKRLLLLLCLTVTAGSASGMYLTTSGTLPNGGKWEKQGTKLYIDAEEVPDYMPNYQGCAPWCRWADIYTVEFSSKIKKIGKHAFWHCESINTVYFRDKSQADVEIGGGAFRGCYNLHSFQGTYIKRIGQEAFSYCYSLEKLVLPAVEFIGRDAFDYCLKLYKDPKGAAEPSIWLTGNTLPTWEKQSQSWDTGGGIEITSQSVWHDSEGNYKTYKASKFPGSKIIVAVTNSSKLSSLDNAIKSYSCFFTTIGGALSDDANMTYTWCLRQNPSHNYSNLNNKELSYLYIYTYKDMDDYNSASSTPWYSYRSQVKSVGICSGSADDIYIGKNAFNGFSNLKKVFCHRGKLAKIGDNAFANCTNLEEFNLKFTQEIGKGAFASTKLYNRLNIPEARKIGDDAFNGTYFKEITFGDNLRSIGQNAFKGSFTDGGNIYVFSAVPTTSSNAFQGANFSETTLHVDANLMDDYKATEPWSSFAIDKVVTFPAGGYNPTWELTKEGLLTIRGNVPDYSKPSDQPWNNYHEFIKSVEFISTTTIGAYAFAFENEGESRITEFTIPSSVITIGAHAFENNDRIKTIVGTGVREVGDYAFANCSSIESYKFGEDVQKFGNNVFSGCGLVDMLSVDAATPPAVTAQTFQGLGVVSNNAPAHVKAKARSRASGQKSVTLEVPDAHISKYLAAQYWNLFSFEYIGEHGGIVESDQAYDGLYVLYEDGTIIASASAPTDPQNVNTGFTISSNARAKVKRVEIQGTLEKLGHQFRDCPNLEEVVLSSGITSLNGTFCNCPKLKTINLNNVSALKTHSSYPAFKGCTALTTVNLPNAVEIGDNCFQGCTSLADVTLGGSCEIGMAAFSGCTNLKSIDLGAADLNGAAEAFKNCTNLQSVTYSGTRMPAEIFKGCSALTAVNLGAQLQDIKSEAFVGTAVNKIYVQCPTPPEAASDAFEGLNLSNIRLYVPAVYGQPYRKADVWKEMSLYEDGDYQELDFPLYFSIGSNGVGVVDESRSLILDAQGALDANIRDYVASYAPYIENEICIGDEVTSLPAGSPYKLPFGWVTSDGPHTLVIGYGVTEMGDYALYSNVWIRDLTIDCYAMTPPTMQGEHVFNWNRVGAGSNGESPATLNVLNDPEIVAAYKAHPYWSKFNICGTLSSSILKVRAVNFDVSEVTLHPGEQLQLEPRFTPESVENKTLRYEDVSGGHHVYIDSDNNLIFAQSEGVAYIQAYSSYTVSGEEVMALWGPTQEIYLKITISAPEPGQEIFFDYREGEGTDAPTITCHVLRDEQLDVDTWIKTCEIAGSYNEDDITTQAIPEWRTGAVNIPEEAMGYEVVRVGAFSFYERQISALYIPWTVTQIGYNACAYCDYLTDVYIPSYQPLRLTDAYGEEDENLYNNDAFYRIGEGDDGEGYATLHVPAGSKAAWDIYPWNEWFRYIVEDAPIPDGIKETKANEANETNGSYGSWFDLSGRKLMGKPSQKGIYVNGGKKVLVK